MKKWKLTITASVIKLILIPGIFLPLAVWMGFRNEEMVALLILTGAPTTVSSYIMAKNMHNDEVLSSGIVVATTLMSSVTLTAIIFFLKSFAII